MSYELHHLIKRKKTASSQQNTILKTALDGIAYPIAILVPLSSLDQIIQIWSTKSVEGVSILVWFMLFLTSIFWIFYGAVHREKVIFFGHIVWLVLSSIVLFEIIILS